MNENDLLIQETNQNANYNSVQQTQVNHPMEYGSISEDNKSLGQSSHQDAQSIISKSDLFPKTNMFQTIVNIVKGYIGLGILAAPSGYLMTGYILATIIILLTGILNTYTIHCQTRAKEVYGAKVKTFTGLAQACYGQRGEIFIAVVIIVGQLMCCSGYIIFFYEEIESVLQNFFNDPTLDVSAQLFIFSLVLLIPLILFFESLKQISYISAVAMASILVSLIYVLITDVAEIENPTYDKTYHLVDFSGIPHFFGIALFMFGGNALSIEIYGQMENGPKNFNNALAIATQITASMIIIVGSCSYAAYGQYTQTVILLNLKSGTLAYIVQLFYSIGIIISCCLQAIPIFSIIKIIPWYQRIPESTSYPRLKYILTRAITTVFCCSLAYIIPDLSSFLNLQGALTGTVIAFIFPLMCFLKAFGDKVSFRERMFCYTIIVYGIIGGSIAFIYSLMGLF